MSSGNVGYNQCIRVNSSYHIISGLSVRICGYGLCMFIKRDINGFITHKFGFLLSEMALVCDEYSHTCNTEFGVYTSSYKVETTKFGGALRFKKTYFKSQKIAQILIPDVGMLALTEILPIISAANIFISNNLLPQPNLSVVNA
jgi:hypothetical protein